MKFTIQRDPDGTLKFSGEFTEVELATLNLDDADLALLRDISGDPKATAADQLLGLEMIYRRFEQSAKTVTTRGPVVELTVVRDTLDDDFSIH